MPLCLRQFRFRSASKRSKPAQHTTTGWRTYKDSTTTNYTCCKDLSVNAFFHVRATHLTRQVGSLPLAKNAKHSSSIRVKLSQRYIAHELLTADGQIFGPAAAGPAGPAPTPLLREL